MNTIEELSAQFHEQTRINGSKFWSLKPDNYDKYIDIVRNIHGTEFLPDDYRYGIIVSLLDKLQEYTEPLDQDNSSEIIDSLVDIGNYDLSAWLKSNISRGMYVDEACEELGYPKEGIFKALQYGQYKEIEEIYNNLISELMKLEA